MLIHKGRAVLGGDFWETPATPSRGSLESILTLVALAGVHLIHQGRAVLGADFWETPAAPSRGPLGSILTMVALAGVHFNAGGACWGLENMLIHKGSAVLDPYFWETPATPSRGPLESILTLVALAGVHFSAGGAC